MEFVINDHNNKLIETLELTNANKCINIINSKFQSWGEKRVGESDYFTLIPSYQSTKVRLFFLKSGYLEYEFVFTHQYIYIYIGDNKIFEIFLDMKEVINNNSILDEIIDLLFLSIIRIREYVQFRSTWIYFFDKNKKLLKKIKSKK